MLKISAKKINQNEVSLSRDVVMYHLDASQDGEGNSSVNVALGSMTKDMNMHKA